MTYSRIFLYLRDTDSIFFCAFWELMKIDGISNSNEIIQFLYLLITSNEREKVRMEFYREIHTNSFDYYLNFIKTFFDFFPLNIVRKNTKAKHTWKGFMLSSNVEKRMSIKCIHFEQLASVSNEELKYESAACMLLNIEWTTVVGNCTIGHHVFLQKFNTILHMNIVPIVAHTLCSRLKIAGNKWNETKKK